MNARILPLLAALFGLLALQSGCASITRGTKDTLVVESDPAGANVRLSTGATGQTPTSFKLPRKKELDVVIEKDGYEPLTVHVSSQVSGKGSMGMAGNVLVGGLIGAGVDAYSGAMKDLRPNPVTVKLVPVKRSGDPVASAPSAAPTDASAEKSETTELSNPSDTPTVTAMGISAAVPASD
jgi:hypothetical protein